MPKYTKTFEEVGLNDIPLVGGKNASLGEMIRSLKSKGIRVPDGFIITADAYTKMLSSGSRAELDKILRDIDGQDVDKLTSAGQKARAVIKGSGLPAEVANEICAAYKKMEERYGENVDVAVRSSATAEDLPEASFAGQQESFLNVRGETSLLEACLNCFASLFTDRAISYRVDKGFEHMAVRLSIGVQKMVRSDLAAAGVIFTIDPESGFANAVLITSAYGLGENVVAGRVDPDEFLVFKQTLLSHPNPIIRHKVGSKQQRMIYSGHGTRTTRNVEVAPEEREQLSLSDDEVITLAKWACIIETHYSHFHEQLTPMDIEWAKDGADGQLYIVQARPETVHGGQSQRVLHNYRLEKRSSVLLTGRSIGEKIGSGRARVIVNARELNTFKDGEILVADMTDPDWEPIMKRASGIVTNRGGRTCHAAIISRELGVPCVVGTEFATTSLKSGDEITVCCSDGAVGRVYDGLLPVTIENIELDELPAIATKILINAANPENAFKQSFLPVQGVGLAREEFIIANEIKVHPLALTRFDLVKDSSVRDSINKLTSGYKSKEEYFVAKLAEGVGMIAAAFHPRDVIVRLSDFKTNEYANLLGGKQFEPVEDNPMIGFRGASRYYDERYKDGFALECKALSKVREEMGLTNVKIMIPFCRTVEEGKLVLQEMAEHNLVRGNNGLEVYIMCELPSNVWCINEFAKEFDGFSIGSNDLTQLTLGVDRDSEIVAHLFDERNDAVKRAIEHAIVGAKRNNRKIGICGQAPSDYPEVVRFLIEQGIDSISLNEDAVLPTLLMVEHFEKELKSTPVR